MVQIMNEKEEKHGNDCGTEMEEGNQKGKL